MKQLHLTVLMGLLVIGATAHAMGGQVAAEPPAVEEKADLHKGGIVVRIDDGGMLSTEAFRTLDKPKDVVAYVAREKERLEDKGIEPCLCLVGVRKPVLKYGIKVAHCAREAGVDLVVFSFISRPKVIREAEGGDEALDVNQAAREVVIVITEAGRVVLNGEDVNPGLDDRSMKLLIDGLKLMAKNHQDKEDGLNLVVIADENTPHLLVRDVLNALAAADIKKVYFRGGPAGIE